MISLGAFFMTLQSALFMQQPMHEALLLAGFMSSGTFFYYGLHDYYTKVLTTKKTINSDRQLFWNRHYRQMLSAMLVVAMLAVWLGMKTYTPFRLLVFLLGGFITLFYSFPLLPFPGLHRWKEHALIKLTILSGMWAAICTFIVMPAYETLTWPIVWLFLLRWLFMIALCLPFEVRDANLDKAVMKKTLPEMFGQKGLLILLIICLMGYLTLLAIAQLQHWLSVLTVLAAIVHLAYTSFLIRKSILKTYPPIMYLWLDVQIILQPIIVGAGAWFTYIRWI